MKTLNCAVVCAALLALVSLFPEPLAAQSDASAPAPSTTLARRDRSFLETAGKAGNQEISISQGVMDHLTNPQVREFAKTMIADHTTIGAQAAALAASKNVALPPADDKVAAEWAAKDNGADKDYIATMVKDHKGAVDLFEKASKSDDPDIAAFAQKTLPTIQHHLMMAEDLQKGMQ